MAYCSENGAAPQETEEFTALPGSGLSAKLNGSALLGGSVKFISENSEMPEELRVQFGLPEHTPVIEIRRTAYTYGEKPVEYHVQRSLTDRYHYKIS